MLDENSQAVVNRCDKVKPVAVRVAPLHYLVILLLVSFGSAYLLYLELELTALALLSVAWVTLPLLAFFDRVVFDGKRIRRTGVFPRMWALMTSTRDRIKLSDVEMVQTNILRTIRRGGNHIYTYRTALFGKGKVFAIHSGRNGYGPFIETVLPLLDSELLDQRSIELRDNFAERHEIKRRAREEKIPTAEILESSLKEFGKKAVVNKRIPENGDTNEKAIQLHHLANQLRVSGLLPQSIEAFRRAMLLMPRDARLLFDFALCLRSYARTQRDKTVERRALAMVRLAERRAGSDGELLARIGEGYFQFGEWRRAAYVFKKAVTQAGERFRTMIGLAEIALHEGKIAHVIHNFSAAGELAKAPSLRRWTKNEIEYFSRLNDDEEYMELEISRMNLLDTLDSVKRSSLRIAIVGFPAIILGILTGDSLIANIGWAVSIVALSVWAASILRGHMLSTRIPYDLVDTE